MFRFKSIWLPAALALAVTASPALAHGQGQGQHKHHPKPSFEALDANKDGGVTLEELKAAAADKPRMLKKADKIFKRLDKNGDNKIDQAEFKAKRQHKQHRQHQKGDK